MIIVLVLATTIVLPGVAGATSSVRAPRPVRTKATDLSASPSSLSAAGGTVTLSATVSAATSCTFTGITPPQEYPIAGLPVTEPCGSGPVSVTVSIPGNGCCILLHYRFHLTVSGTRTLTKRVVVAVPPAAVIDCNDPEPFADLEGCDFSNQNLQGGYYQGADFSSANLTNTNMSDSELADAVFDSADLSGTNFTGSDLTSAGLLATLTDTDFVDANLTGAQLADPEALSTVIWGNTTCPDGTNSNADGGTCANNLNG